jgi:hypothetical protein
MTQPSVSQAAPLPSPIQPKRARIAFFSFSSYSLPLSPPPPFFRDLFKKRPAGSALPLPPAKLPALQPPPSAPCEAPATQPSETPSPSAPAPGVQSRALAAAVSTSDWKLVESSVLFKRYGVAPAASASIKLAAFDMDGTIIKTKSGSSRVSRLAASPICSLHAL